MNDNKMAINVKGDYPIRILHCVAGLNRGGYETFLLNIFKKIDRNKVQFDFLYSFDGSYKKEILELGGKVYQIPFITKVGPFAYEKSVSDFLKEHKEYKIVHSHMDKFSGLIMKVAKKNNIPVRISHAHNIKNEGGLAYQLVKNYFGMMINSNATDLLACSKDASDWMFKNRSNEALVIKNGIDLKRFSRNEKIKHEFIEKFELQNKFLIGNIARFTHQKNHEFLIEVFSKCLEKNKNAHLLLAGDGQLFYKMQEKIKAMNLQDDITLLKEINDVSPFLNSLDVYVMPSKFEGLGISLIEAQAMKLPCVISDKIPKEAIVSANVRVLSLNDKKEIWVDAILSSEYKECVSKDIEKFDIENVSALMQEYYLNKF